jgi:hypothetical protein
MLSSPKNFLDELLAYVYDDIRQPSIKNIIVQAQDLIALYILNNPFLISF